MEKPEIETPKSPSCFPPHRKSHLQSETYHTLVRILSQCYKHPELCEPAPAAPKERKADNDSIEQVKASEKDGCENVELATRNSMSVNEKLDSGFPENAFSETQVVVNDIENIMRIEEDNYPSEQNDGTNKTGLGDQGFGELQELLMDELEHVMKGDELVVGDKNCNLKITSMDENLNRNDIGAVTLSNDQEHLDLLATATVDCSTIGQQQVDKGHSSQYTLKSVESSSDKSRVGDVPEVTDKSEDKSSLFTANELGANCEMQKKDVESEKVAGSPNQVTEAAEIEEGEISGKFEVNEKSIHVFSDLAASHEQKKQLSDEPRNEMVHKRKVVVYEDPFLSEVANASKKQKKGSETKEPKKGSRTRKKNKSDVGSDNLASSAKKPDQNATCGQGITCKEKGKEKDKKKLPQDAAVCDKKKRGPISQERKAKKKAKERKKRAQKNRELGVKRLKLRPMEKPKTVTPCRHYLKGRCHEGEKCKFSHDVIPLTKSKPCSHFARHSCLKGDDCPFDHELSKYPCTNYATTGSCIRGQDCMFSHKLPLKEDLPSTSNVCTSELKLPSLPDISNSKKQLNSGGTPFNIIKTSPSSAGNVSQKNMEKNVAKSSSGSLVPMPKGITLFSAGKSSVTESSHSTPGKSSLARNEGSKAECQADRSASGTVQNSNETPKRSPLTVTPKGINFLSFGKAPSEFLSTKKFTGNDSGKLPLSNNFSEIKQSISPLNMGNSIQGVKETSQSMPKTVLRLNNMLQKTEFVPATPSSKTFSFGESSMKGSRSTAQDTFPSSSATCVGRSVQVQASEIAPEKHNNSNAISQERSISPLGSGQPANYLAHACLKNTPNSAQKALMSTLAFAAKVESGMKMKQSTTDAIAVSSGAGKETGMARGPQVNSAKASKILDFLSTIGSK